MQYGVVPPGEVFTDPQNIPKDFIKKIWDDHLKACDDPELFDMLKQFIWVNNRLMHMVSEIVSKRKDKVFVFIYMIKEMILSLLCDLHLPPKHKQLRKWVQESYYLDDYETLGWIQQMIREYAGYFSVICVFLVKLTGATKLPFVLINFVEEKYIHAHIEDFEVFRKEALSVLPKTPDNKNLRKGLFKTLSRESVFNKDLSKKEKRLDKQIETLLNDKDPLDRVECKLDEIDSLFRELGAYNGQ